jgi:hypothetical protein
LLKAKGLEKLHGHFLPPSTAVRRSGRDRLHAKSEGLDRHVDPNGISIEVLTSAKGSWSILSTRPSGHSCLAAAGGHSSEAHGGEFFRKLSLQTLNNLGAVVAIVRGGRWYFGAQGVPADIKDGQDRGNTGSHGGASEQHGAKLFHFNFPSSLKKLLKHSNFIERG